MKILIIHNSYKEFGGEDSVVQNQIKLFESNGDDVYPYIVSNMKIDNYSKVEKVQLLKNAYASPETNQEITKIISDFNPDIAHIHNIYPLISPVVYKILHENNIPIVQTLHNYRFICPNGLFFRDGEICTKCLDKKSYYQCGVNQCYHDSYVQSFWYADIISRGSKWFKYIDKFIALNPFIKDMMIQRGFNSKKISIVPNFSYEIDVKNDEKSNEEYVLYLGRLTREKGIETLLKSMDKIDGMKLFVAGEGELKENVLSAEKSGKVKYLGFVNGDEKNSLIKNATALIVPSEWYEPFGMVAIEAMALGTPVIASEIGGLKYLIEDGRNGVLFNPGDVDDLVRKINYIRYDSDNSALSKTAQKLFKEKYTAEVVYQEIKKINQSVAESKEIMKV